MKKTIYSIITVFLLFFSFGAKAQNALVDVENSLKNYVSFITNDSVAGRAAGSKGEKIVAAYIYDVLKNNGLTMLSPREGDDFKALLKDTIVSQNIIGIVEGYDPKLKNEYIVIGAHYDHLGFNKISINGKVVVQIYSGADDNASGVAGILELANFIEVNKYMFKRSVIFAFFGAEELGMLGSWYFVNRSFKEIDNVALMVNLDMVGRSGGDNYMRVFTVGQNLELNSIIESLSSRSASLNPVIANTDYFPSDHINFYEKGIPVALFTSGLHREYHTHKDIADRLDYGQMAQLLEYVYALAQRVANLDKNLAPVVLKQEFIGSDGKEIIYTQQDVDKKALFLHGDERQFLDKWVYPYLKYPQGALDSGISGRVTLEFIVNKNGVVENVTVVKSVSDDLDDEAVRVVSASPKWKPAKYKGEDVSVRISIPVEFKLLQRSTSPSFKVKK